MTFYQNSLTFYNLTFILIQSSVHYEIFDQESPPPPPPNIRTVPLLLSIPQQQLRVSGKRRKSVLACQLWHSAVSPDKSYSMCDPQARLSLFLQFSMSLFLWNTDTRPLALHYMSFPIRLDWSFHSRKKKKKVNVLRYYSIPYFWIFIFW